MLVKDTLDIEVVVQNLVTYIDAQTAYSTEYSKRAANGEYSLDYYLSRERYAAEEAADELKQSMTKFFDSRIEAILSERYGLEPIEVEPEEIEEEEEDSFIPYKAAAVKTKAPSEWYYGTTVKFDDSEYLSALLEGVLSRNRGVLQNLNPPFSVASVMPTFVSDTCSKCGCEIDWSVGTTTYQCIDKDTLDGSWVCAECHTEEELAKQIHAFDEATRLTKSKANPCSGCAFLSKHVCASCGNWKE